ncbi:PP103 [Orf virus]|uniref:PP103 n=1 Tax=Orf virus TaxID=10258 RepID=F1AX04_ORFV|nr:PP103 [Orf virus]
MKAYASGVTARPSSSTMRAATSESQEQFRSPSARPRSSSTLSHTLRSSRWSRAPLQRCLESGNTAMANARRRSSGRRKTSSSEYSKGNTETQLGNISMSGR